MKKSVKMMLKGGMIALLLFFGLTASQNARAQTGVTLSFDPAEIVATTCGTQTVEVWVEDVVDLTGYHLEISFDPGVIEVTDVVNGGFLAPPGESALYEPTNSIDNDNGLILFGLVQQGDGTGDPLPKSGDGVLIEITLRAVVPNETSAITIDADNSILVDWPDVSPIDFTTSDGSVTTESCQPTDIGIIDNWIPENEQVGTEVGFFYTIDPDLPNDFFTYELVPGTGDVDNDSFEIVGSSLKTKEVFNYEEQMIYRIRVRSTDWGGKTFEKAFLIFVLDVNDPPVAVGQNVSTTQETPIDITLTGLDEDGDDLSFTIVLLPSHGDLSGTAPNLVYTPDAGFVGSDIFTFKVNDGTVDSNTTTVTITVTAVNDAPVAQDQSVETPEDTALPITLVATDAENDTLTYAIVAEPTHGSVTLDDNIATYTPAANFHGTDTFTFKANDGELDSNVATVTITVTPVNDAPVAQAGSDTTEEEIPVDVTLVASDVDGDALTYAIVALPVHGSMSLDGDVATYTPAANFHGTDTFTFKANDGTVDSNIATVTITVTAVNDAPVAQAGSETTEEEIPVDVTLVATDAENDELEYAIVDQPAHGSMNLVDDVATYTPALDFNGTDTFTYQANDGTADSNIATVTITVTAVNDAPVAVDDEYTVAEKETLTIAAPGVLGNDSDVEGDTLTAILVDTVSNGTLTLNADGSFTYTPNAYFNGTDSFTYKAKDAVLESDLAVVTITVAPVNDWPIANDDFYEVVTGTELVKDAAEGVLANDVLLDPDEEVSIQILDEPLHGDLSMNDDGSFTYIPDAGYMGTDTFRYMVLSVQTINADEWSDDATVTITVQPLMRLFLPLILR